MTRLGESRLDTLAQSIPDDIGYGARRERPGQQQLGLRLARQLFEDRLIRVGLGGPQACREDDRQVFEAPRAERTARSLSSASTRASASKSDLPIPAGPSTSTRLAAPSAAEKIAASSVSSSCSRSSRRAVRALPLVRALTRSILGVSAGTLG